MQGAYELLGSSAYEALPQWPRRADVDAGADCGAAQQPADLGTSLSSARDSLRRADVELCVAEAAAATAARAGSYLGSGTAGRSAVEHADTPRRGVEGRPAVEHASKLRTETADDELTPGRAPGAVASNRAPLPMARGAPTAGGALLSESSLAAWASLPDAPLVAPRTASGAPSLPAAAAAVAADGSRKLANAPLAPTERVAERSEWKAALGVASQALLQRAQVGHLN